MTVSQIHEYMAQKVIPESVVPQNISNWLMDEGATIPELDAFTFLNRVRSLGIGSADFLYLLKGCDAPEEAVAKIESNPAMNLASLIVTLENSGLTSQDYTRMLYTARQLWERTLTMRIDKPVLEEAEETEPPKVSADRLDEVLTARQIPKSSKKDDFPEVLTARQRPKQEEAPEVLTARQLPEKEEAPEALTARQLPKKEYVGREDYKDFYDEDIPVARHNGKIIVSAVFAALLMGLNAALSVFGFSVPAAEDKQKMTFAADSAEVFGQIYSGYTSGKLGGEDVFGYRRQESVVFGELLVESSGGLGTYTLGGRAFSVHDDGIVVYEASGNTAAQVCEILPPEGTEFVDISQSGELLVLVYSDDNGAGICAFNEQCETVYNSWQSGALTDVYFGVDTVSLGTVYTPAFRQSFTVEQTEFYLPQFSFDGAASIMSASEIAMGSGEGCSYAVYGCYSLADGALKQRCAALGDPVFSGAEEFLAVMRGAEGFALVGKGTDEQPLISRSVGTLLACDVGDTVQGQLSEDAQPYDSVMKFEREQHITATAQTDESGTTVYLHGIDFEPLSALTNIGGEIKSLKLSGGVLYIIGEQGVIMAADISDPQQPKPLALTATTGILRDGQALCAAVSDTVVKLTLYREDENSAISEAASSTKVVTLGEGGRVAVGEANTFFIGDNRFGAAYSYFDGVSEISEYAVFGRTRASHSLFDEREGFGCAAELDGALYLIYGGQAIKIN